MPSTGNGDIEMVVLDKVDALGHVLLVSYQDNYVLGRVAGVSNAVICMIGGT